MKTEQETHTTPARPDCALPAVPGVLKAPGTGLDWRYSVSVRALCEFTAKRGDLDRRFTPSATAQEGLRGQGLVASRRGQDYETEVALEGQVGRLRLRGRADGYDPRYRCLEEVKAIRGRPEDIPENRRQLHWAQLQTYGALFCRSRQLAEVALSLVYFDVASQTETELKQLCSAVELEEALTQRCAQFMAWAEQEAQHRLQRDAALAQLGFPSLPFRSGQRELAEAVYRSTVHGRSLLAQAPTGIGKTLGTLFPTLRAMPGQGVDKLAFLTCKGTGRVTALEALAELRSATPGQALRVVLMVAKDQACEHPDKACHGDACPLARGFFDRLPAARHEAVALGWLDAAAQRQVALRHGICPFYLGQELVRWGDVVVGDVNHLLDVQGQLWGLMQAMDWRLAVLIDEAHNLVERARAMYSGELGLRQLRAVTLAAPAAVRSALEQLVQATEAVVIEAAPPYTVLDAAPDEFVQALSQAAGALAEHFHQQPLAVGPFLDFHFELRRYLHLVDALNDHALFDVQRLLGVASVSSPAEENAAPAADLDAVLCVRNVAPACFLRQRFKALHSVTLFSATLSPPDYARQLLGLPDNTAWIDVPPAFAPEHLVVQLARGLSTRHRHRLASLQPLVDVLAQQFDAHPGNYLAFFSSFEYLNQAADRLATVRPDITQWRQDRRMGAADREAFLARFQTQGRGIAFAVLGGVFAEGVDLPGRRLIGAFIATLGLPPVSVTQDHMRSRLEQLFGAGQGYADLVPAMQKVVQAAGRVIRTPEDRGWLWLLDDRYQRADVRRLLPSWWGLAG